MDKVAEAEKAKEVEEVDPSPQVVGEHRNEMAPESTPILHRSEKQCRELERIYDNWEKLVGATLKRDLLRQLALLSSTESSFNSTATQSDFSDDTDNYNEHEFNESQGGERDLSVSSGRREKVVVSKSDEEGGAGGGGGDVQNGGNQMEEERKDENSRRHRGERRRSKPNPRLSNPPKNIHGEQVAAGWPSWLSAVAGEAINGWTPRRADTFEKIDKA
ncbi:hypothetical protein RD792_017198 [Penstemon davidsonii]|uniref:Uncharacterized protein n=1 Tax=Penstemon davidsonii TaxID=160366 RepID=A0ABR0CLB6_9LAMI|nr:hypothetical protein RD792_017198 [Penstemon davidsonii]